MWLRQGLLLPLCQSGTCTLREAVILSSVLTRVSLPMLHSAAALARLAGMAYSGVNSFFIRVLLDKKYALPYRVIDALVDHFLSFRKEERTLPVVWHQSLLTFVQRCAPLCNHKSIPSFCAQRVPLACSAFLPYLSHYKQCKRK